MTRMRAMVYNGWRPTQSGDKPKPNEGVSQSILQYFTNDRDRLHKKAVLGLRSKDRKEAMEYGTLFHKLIEEGARMGSRFTKNKLEMLMKEFLEKRYPSEASLNLCKLAMIEYYEYRKWEATRPKHTYIDQEPVFCEPFRLPALRFKPNDEISIQIPSGMIIPLRGRIDEVIEDHGMWIQENKTKGQINPSFIQDTIHSNIQVMFYAVCAEIKYNRPCKGVIYNVIRKPGLKQRKTESILDYYNRVQEEIEAQPDYYFYRFKYAFQPGQVARWKREELLPLLYQVYIWWKSIEKNPTVPWMDADDGSVNPFHGRKSFGIYDPMSSGKGDFYDLIVYGRKQGLVHDPEMFPELKEDEDDD